MEDVATCEWTRIRTTARSVASVGVTLALTLLAPGMAEAQVPTWRFQTLDGSGSVVPGHTTDSVGTSTAVTDFDGQIHAFTFDATVGSLRHEWWNGARWNFETLDGPGSTRPGHTVDKVGEGIAVTVWKGQLHVFAYDATARSLRHEWWNGAHWNFETLDGTGSTRPGHTSHTIGQSISAVVYGSQLHVFASDDTTFSLRHDWWTGAAWAFQTLDGNGSILAGHVNNLVGDYSAPVVFAGYLHVFNYDGTTGSLRHEWWDGARWHFETLDGAASTVPGHTADSVGVLSAVIVFDGQLHVFTADNTTAALRHEWWDDARWHFETLDGTGSTFPGHTTDDVGLDNVAIIFANQLHVFNFDNTFTLEHGVLTGGSLRHAWWDGARWHFQTLDGKGSTLPGHTTDNVGAFDAAVTVASSQLHLFAADQTSNTLRHDWWN
jgi:hypothetical protein